MADFLTSNDINMIKRVLAVWAKTEQQPTIGEIVRARFLFEAFLLGAETEIELRKALGRFDAIANWSSHEAPIVSSDRKRLERWDNEGGAVEGHSFYLPPDVPTTRDPGQEMLSR